MKYKKHYTEITMYMNKKLVIIFLAYCLPAWGIPLDDAYFQVAQAFKQQENMHEALLYFEKTITTNPNNIQALYELGLYYYSLGSTPQAASYFERACSLDEHQSEAMVHAGACAMLLGQTDKAFNYYQKAVEIQPQSPKNHFLLGIAYKKKNQIDQAQKEFELTIQLCPHAADAHVQLANILRDTHKINTALHNYEKALALAPSSSIHMEKAHALAMAGQTEQALELYNQVAQQTTIMPTLLHGMAFAYKKNGNCPQAIELYRQLLATHPDHPHARFGLALALLAQGDMYAGLQELAITSHSHITEKPRLADLLSARNKKILITTSWNNDDMIQFLPCVQMLKQQDAYVIVQTNRIVEPLFALCPYIDEVIGTTPQKIPEFDMHIPLCALPALCVGKNNQFPALNVSLHAPENLKTVWYKKIRNSCHTNVGIYLTSKDIFDNLYEETSLPLCAILPLLSEPSLHIYALHSLSKEEIASVPDSGLITLIHASLTPEKDILSFTALLNSLDCVITCDSLTAHLAGGLGKPTVLVVPPIPQWRWGMSCGTSPFYPTMRIVRREKNESMQSVSNKIRQELIALKMVF